MRLRQVVLALVGGGLLTVVASCSVARSDLITAGKLRVVNVPSRNIQILAVSAYGQDDQTLVRGHVGKKQGMWTRAEGHIDIKAVTTDKEVVCVVKVPLLLHKRQHKHFPARVFKAHRAPTCRTGLEEIESGWFVAYLPALPEGTTLTIRYHEPSLSAELEWDEAR